MGRREEFEHFYEGSFVELARVLGVVLGDPHLGADAVQEAMARAYSRWATVSLMDNPRGWVYRVALNAARSRLRRIRRESLWAQLPEEAVEQRRPESGERLLEGLTLDQRSVVVLRFYLDWSVEQTAAALGIRPGTVKSRCSRALEVLRQTVEVDHA